MPVVNHLKILIQKKKLKNVIENYDESLTEAQNMFNNNYRRIWDSGKIRWVM